MASCKFCGGRLLHMSTVGRGRLDGSFHFRCDDCGALHAWTKWGK